LAARLAGRYGSVTFIATGEGLDGEMAQRIKKHKVSRPKRWSTVEEPLEISRAVGRIAGQGVIIIDCLTLLVSNHMMKGRGERAISKEISRMCGALKRSRADSIVVSNEVGLGIVPANALAREFRDIAGRVNQLVAASSDRVYFAVSGIPWRIK
jgi:adenosylcobinamide kinase/adenosylcobinamide-phosphate guanylyltransferase